LIRDEFCSTQLASAETSGERFFLPGLIANQRGRHAESVAWYRTMRLFRQPHGGGGWEPVVAEVAEELKSATRRSLKTEMKPVCQATSLGLDRPNGVPGLRLGHGPGLVVNPAVIVVGKRFLRNDLGGIVSRSREEI
jgi:hypothetical protein